MVSIIIRYPVYYGTRRIEIMEAAIALGGDTSAALICWFDTHDT